MPILNMIRNKYLEDSVGEGRGTFRGLFCSKTIIIFSLPIPSDLTKQGCAICNH